LDIGGWSSKLKIRNENDMDMTLTFSNSRIAVALGIYQDMQQGELPIQALDIYKCEKKINIYHLAPSGLFIHSNFTDTNLVNEKSKRLMAVIDTSGLYEAAGKITDIESFHMTMPNINPILSKINTNNLKHMSITLETPQGFPFPFNKKNSQNNSNQRCLLNMSFSSK